MEGSASPITASARTLGQLCDQAGLPRPTQDSTASLAVTGFTDDSRLVVPGACFIAVQGHEVDGHDFIEEAVRRGAAVIICERSTQMSSEIGVLRLPDTRSAVSRLASVFYGLVDHDLSLIGVTGTNGKSTTCEILQKILKSAGQKCALLGTIRNDLVSATRASRLTTPGPIQVCEYLCEAAEAGAKHAVMEVSSHALDQHRCAGLDFSVAVLTNISGDHLDYHGTTDAYVAAKKRLFDALDPSAVAVINGDDDFAGQIVSDCQGRVVRYGIDSSPLDSRAELTTLTAEGSVFTVIGPRGALPVQARLIGKHNVMNILAAATCAREMGVDDQAIRRGIESIDFVRGRLEPVCVDGQRFSVLVDYAHTDDALERVLSATESLTSGRLICVFGCGGDRDRSKRPRMAAAVGRHADLAIVTNDNPRDEDPEAIVEDILPGFEFNGRCSVEIEPNRRTAIQLAVFEASPGDTVLIAGKGHEQFQITGTVKQPFDDVAEAKRCLSTRFDVADEVHA